MPQGRGRTESCASGVRRGPQGAGGNREGLNSSPLPDTGGLAQLLFRRDTLMESKLPMATQQHPTMPWRRIHKPSAAELRAWRAINDSAPPDGEADGYFRSFTHWVDHAASYIGGTGAKCFDAKDRPCRNGADFQRARDESAFPVRWYLPERFS